MVQQQQGNFLSRAVRSAGSGESAFGTLISGTGEVWIEPTGKHFIFASMEGNDSMLLDDKAYYAAQGSLKLSSTPTRRCRV